MAAKIFKKKANWSVNPEDRYFLFTDGSFRPEYRHGVRVNVLGCGAELRDKSGQKVMFYSEEFEYAKNELPEQNPEIITIEKALDLFYSQGVRCLVIQTDFKGMAEKIDEFVMNDCKHNESALDKLKLISRLIWHDLFDKIAMFDDVFAEYIPRELNENADFLSRSAKILKDKDIALENAIKVKQMTRAKDLSRLKAQTNPNKGTNSALFTHDLNPMYVLSSDLFQKKWMLFDFVDLKELNRFEVKVKTHDEIPVLIQTHFHNIVVNYEKEEKGIALAFILMNLITEKSSVSLINPLTASNVKKEIHYNHQLWSSFTKVKNSSFLLDQAKKAFFLNNELEILLKETLSSLPAKKNLPEQLLDVLFSEKGVAPINLFRKKEIFNKIISLQSGKVVPLDLIASGVIPNPNKSPIVPSKKKEEKKLKPVTVDKKQNSVATPFSFLSYGLEMKKTVSV